MSLVGPRPLLIQYLDRLLPPSSDAVTSDAGPDGWAQSTAGTALTWQDKFALDVWYVDRWSLWLDLKIIVLTVWKSSPVRVSINPAMQRPRSSGGASRP